jgi:dihydrofolate reductase
MGKIIADVSVSLDGFMAGPNISIEHPMGKRGDRLHQWLFNAGSNEIDSTVVKGISAGIGAVVLGRRTFDVGFNAWEQQTPYPAPTFVVTHHAKDALPTASGTFTFITDGAARAVEQARTAAGDKNVAIMGAGITQELIRLAVIDELHIHMTPVLLGDGLRLFEHLGGEQIELEIVETTPSSKITHFIYRVLK